MSDDNKYVILYAIGKTPIDTINALIVLANSINDPETLKVLQYKKVVVTGTLPGNIRPFTESPASTPTETQVQTPSQTETPVQEPTQTPAETTAQTPTQNPEQPVQACKKEADKA